MQTNIQTIQTVIADLKSASQIQTPQLQSAVATLEAGINQLNAHVANLQTQAALAAKELENAKTVEAQRQAEIAKLQAAAQAAIAPPATPAS